MIRCTHLLTLPLLALLFAGCSAEAADTSMDGIPKTPPSAAAKALMLAADPGEAEGVVDAKITGEVDAITVTGRIRKIAKGFFAFTLMETEVPYCGERNAEDCKTPWDYCCEDGPTITANSLAVEARDASGKAIATPALPDLRHLDAVKVTGKLTVDEHGNHTLLATGIWRAERPTLPAGLIWPQ